MDYLASRDALHQSRTGKKGPKPMHQSSLKFRTSYIEDLVNRRHQELEGNRQALIAWNTHAEQIRAFSKGSATEPRLSHDTPGFGMSTGQFGASLASGDSDATKLRASAPALLLPGGALPQAGTRASQGFSFVRSTDGDLLSDSKPKPKSMKERMQVLGESADANAKEISRRKDFLQGYAALRMQSPLEPSVAETRMLTGRFDTFPTALSPTRRGSIPRRLQEVEELAVLNSRHTGRLKQHFKDAKPGSVEVSSDGFHDDEPSKILSRAESLSRSRAQETLQRCLW